MNSKEKLRQLQDSIARAELKYGRQPGSVRLIGVSKVQPVDKIRAVVDQGLRDIAENYVQEARSKQTQLADQDIRWHFIGKIQSKKSREIAENFDWVHSVDRLKVARRLSEFRASSAPALNVCLQVNLQQEATKAGFSNDEVGDVAAAITNLPGLELRGLMAIPEVTSNFVEQRSTFRSIREVFDRLNQSGLGMDTLSMGMTADMEAAIAEGSTMVRIGTALFGPRPTKPT